MTGDEMEQTGFTIVPGESPDSELCKGEIAGRLGIEPRRIGRVEVDPEDATMVNVTLRAAWEFPESTNLTPPERTGGARHANH